MKKILLPTLLATAVAPVVSLIGCAKPAEPKIVLDTMVYEYDDMITTKQTYDIAKNTRYDFTIDMTNWEITYDVHHFTFIFFEKDQLGDEGAVPLKDDFQFKIGDRVLNGRKGKDLYAGNIDFEDEADIEAIVKTHQLIECYVQTDTWDEPEPTKKCYFAFFCVSDI